MSSKISGWRSTELLAAITGGIVRDFIGFDYVTNGLSICNMHWVDGCVDGAKLCGYLRGYYMLWCFFALSKVLIQMETVVSPKELL